MAIVAVSDSPITFVDPVSFQQVQVVLSQVVLSVTGSTVTGKINPPTKPVVSADGVNAANDMVNTLIEQGLLIAVST
jgi:hypothetical protein